MKPWDWIHGKACDWFFVNPAGPIVYLEETPAAASILDEIVGTGPHTVGVDRDFPAQHLSAYRFHISRDLIDASLPLQNRTDASLCEVYCLLATRSSSPILPTFPALPNIPTNGRRLERWRR